MLAKNAMDDVTMQFLKKLLSDHQIRYAGNMPSSPDYKAIGKKVEEIVAAAMIDESLKEFEPGSLTWS